MNRHLMTLVLSGLVGSLVLAGDAQACCHKQKGTCAPATTCAVAAPVACAAPAPVCQPTCAPRKRHCGFKGMKLGCHKKAACAAPVATCAAPVAACETVAYAAPVSYAAPAAYPSPQASAQR